MHYGLPSFPGGFAMPKGVYQHRQQPLEDRFWAKVNRTTSDGCWVWIGARNSNGYGVFYTKEGSRLAHRIAYEIMVSPIPIGLEPDHLCRTPGCVKPSHLELVTHQVNMGRGLAGWENRAKTHCPQGHVYDEANTYLYRGGRYCRKCHLEHDQQWRERRRLHAIA